MFERAESVGHLINWAARLFVRAIDRHIRPMGIAAGQIPVLLTLAEASPLSQKELVLRSAIEQSTMAATLARMVRAGLVIRRPDTKDGRASLFELSGRGLGVLNNLCAALEQGNRAALTGFSSAEAAQLRDYVVRIIQNLKK